jgi:hypothetical protein
MINDLAKAFGIKPTVLLQECLRHLRPKLKNSPFGRLLSSLVE